MKTTLEKTPLEFDGDHYIKASDLRHLGSPQGIYKAVLEENTAENIPYTRQIIYQRSDGKWIARYQLPTQNFRSSAIGEIVDFLNQFEIELENPAFASLTVAKVFKQYNSGRSIDNKLLQPVPLAQYFDKERPLCEFSNQEFSKMPYTFDHVLIAEYYLVRHILAGFDPDSSEYQPVLLRDSEGAFTGIAYLLYDKSKAHFAMKAYLDQFQRKLQVL